MHQSHLKRCVPAYRTSLSCHLAYPVSRLPVNRVPQAADCKQSALDHSLRGIAKPQIRRHLRSRRTALLIGLVRVAMFAATATVLHTIRQLAHH